MTIKTEQGNVPPNTTVVLIVGVVVVVCFTMAACVAVFVAAPEGANTGSLLALLLGQLAPTVAALALLAKQSSTDAKVDTISEDTSAMTNGLGDAKLRAAIADVLDPSLIDPTALQQIDHDRRRRDASRDPRREP